MAQDIRELFKNDIGIPREGMRPGHHKRFEALLDKKLPVNKNKKSGNLFLWMKIAAVFIVLVAVAGVLYINPLGSGGEVNEPQNAVAATDQPDVQLSDLSPDFKKVEDYYLASINVELARLDVDAGNKDLVDAFLVELETLNKEYKSLNNDLAEIGVNEQTVSALISNLQLRLELLHKLKQKLNELKTGQPNGLKSKTL
ncbi:MAG: hypothetical protein WBG71_12505 [Leeuwenhoekiella sp.]